MRISPSQGPLQEPVFNSSWPDEDDDLERRSGILIPGSNLSDWLNIQPPNASAPPFDVARCGLFPGCWAKLDEASGAPTVECSRATVGGILALTIALAAATVAANLWIVAVVARTRALRKPQAYFKLSLALSGMMYGGVYMSSVAHNIATKIFFNPRDLAQLRTLVSNATDPSRFLAAMKTSPLFVDGRGYAPADIDPTTAAVFVVIAMMSSIVIVLSQLLLAVDAYVAVRWPMSYRIGEVMTRSRAIAATAAVWLFAAGASLMPVLDSEHFSTGLFYPVMMYVGVLKSTDLESKELPIIRNWRGFAFGVVVWGIPVVATWVLTLMMARTGGRMLSNMRTARKLSLKSSRSISRVDRELQRTVIVLLSLFTATALPLFVMQVTVASQPAMDRCYSPAIAAAFFVAFNLFPVSSFLNVLVYNVFHGEFRDASRKLALDIAHRALFCRCFDALLPVYSGRWRKSASAGTNSSWADLRNRRRSSNTSQMTVSDAAAITPLPITPIIREAAAPVTDYDEIADAAGEFSFDSQEKLVEEIADEKC